MMPGWNEKHICPLCSQPAQSKGELLMHLDTTHGDTPLPSMGWYVDHARTLARWSARLDEATEIVRKLAGRKLSFSTDRDSVRLNKLVTRARRFLDSPFEEESDADLEEEGDADEAR